MEGGKKMKQKNRKRIVGLLALSQLGTIAMQVSPMIVHAEIDYSTINSFTSETQSRFNTAKDLMNVAKNTKNSTDIEKAIKAFVNIMPTGNSDNVSIDNYHALDNKELSAIYEGIHQTIYNKPNGAEKDNLAMKFLNAMVLKRGNESQVTMNEYITRFNDENTITTIQDKVDTSIRNLNAIIGVPGEGERPSQIDNPLKENGNNEVVQVNPPDLSQAVPVPEISETTETVTTNDDADSQEADMVDLTWEDIHYESVNGRTVKVTTTYHQLDGKTEVSVSREVVPDMETTAGTEDMWKLFNDVSSLETVESPTDLIEENQNVQSDLTLHYTVTKKAKNVYYYDTGIRVKEDGTATYQQVKDVLYQLAIRSEGYLTDDKGKFLIVVEGKPILIKEIKDSYSKQEIEDMFDGFGEVDMRIMKTRIGTTASLEEQIVSGKAQHLALDGNKVELKTNPITKNSRILLPIEEISKIIGAEVKKDGEKLILTKDKDVVVYEQKVKSIVVNGKVIEVHVPSEKTQSDVLMGEATELLKTFGYNLVWDEEESTIQLLSISK